MIPNQELNEALAKWRWPNPNYDIHMDSTEIKVFESPGHNVPLAQCRLFTLSLDSIWDILVPELGGNCRIVFTEVNWDTGKWAIDFCKGEGRNWNREAVAGLPAFGLCEAIWKAVKP